MHHEQEPAKDEYPHGRGYGHDYMRGGEVFGGYGYKERAEYATPRGDLTPTKRSDAGSGGTPDDSG
jgi:hypothetical protein